MAVVKLFNLEGAQIGDVSLDDRLFGVEADASLVHEVATRQMSNSRVAIAHTKDRGEVAGSGIKPWKQKGTGRARHGSRRSPIWVGGGVTFGPRSDHTYGGKINKRSRRKALAMVLSDKVKNDDLIALETLELAEAKTKKLTVLLGKLPGAKSKTLIVLTGADVSAVRAARNIVGVSTIPADSLNPVDLLKHKRIVVARSGLELIAKTYLSEKKKENTKKQA